MLVEYNLNQGNRYKLITEAIKKLNLIGKIKKTSSLYQTDPKYVEDQNKFINLACELETELQPKDLLVELKNIERNVGRIPTYKNGPREIDIDVILYDNLVIKLDEVSDLGELIIPHKLMHERDFVLGPLSEIAGDIIHPVFNQSIKSLTHKLSGNTIQKIIGFPNGRVLELNNKTIIMGILNCTADSFSDGGKYNTIEKALQRAEIMIKEGADIIDIGGESTRPNAQIIDAELEISRVVPVITALKERYPDVILSVDTNKWEVGKVCIEKGVDIINNVNGTQMDKKMVDLLKETQVPIVIMHNRGTPTTMLQNAVYNDLLGEICDSFRETINICRANQIPDFNIILDPGIGFAKTAGQNCEILRNIHQLKKQFPNHPFLIGPSRKRFIEQYTKVKEPSNRIYGTAACICGIMGGSDIVRVHDVKEMKLVCLMMDAIYK